jgi:hypothetical protein
MKLEKAEKRDKKQNKRKNGQRTDSRSVFTIIQIQRKRAEKVKKNENNNDK